MNNHTKSLPAVLAAFAFLCCGVGAQEVSFNDHVRPILSDKCFHCHGPDATNQESDIRLDTRGHALEAIEPGDLESSELHHRIRSEDDPMPPADAVRQLTEEEKDILDAWISDGAKFDKHWSFLALPEKVTVPQVGEDWATNEIDQFIYARLADEDLRPNKEASKEAWLRRVTFDLTGLPPTLEEIDAFLTDSNPEAYATVVDELLTRESCAERLATEWLDVARYSDSYGYQRDDERYVWPWRDWVIQAFGENMPYDQFITWQLAGDLLPDATREQILATTFNRLHSHKKEGGVAIEEFRVENVADRTHTVGATFMGLTFECARCHDHKYDPITTKDYYRLSSFFANIDENGLISYFTDAVPTPAMPLPTESQERALQQAADKIAEVEKQLDQATQESQERFDAWLAERQPTDQIEGLVAKLTFDSFEKPRPFDLTDEYDAKKKKAPDLDKFHGLKNEAAEENQGFTPKANQLVEGKRGKAIQLTGDDAVEIPNTAKFSRDQPFTCALWIKLAETEARAVIYRHSRGWDDAGSIGYELIKEGGLLNAKLTHFWPGNSICVESTESLEQDKWYHVAVTYDGSSQASGLNIYVDGERAKTKIVQDHLTRQITTWRGGDRNFAIGARYRDRGFKDGQVDEFHVFDRTLSRLEVRQLFDGEALKDLLQLAVDDLSDQQRTDLFEYYVLAKSDAVRKIRTQLQEARVAWNQVMDQTPAITIMREQATPRPAFVLDRGGYDNHGEPVTAGTPGFMPDYLAGQPKNRLGLARWLTSSDHPLTARVTVNRYWQLMFANGLVRTPEDFGVQGDRPTHPELLDWLSRDFINHGWDVRRLLRMIALSSTYRQSAAVARDVRDKDPENRLLARGVGNRLSAEMIRDNILAVSGLLSEQVGGQPAKPYDIRLSYKPSDPDKGEGLYRRSLYTFWQRTAPAPMMTTLNANKRDVCRLRREVAPSPLQALVMLNGTQFVESARVMASNLIEEFGGDNGAIVDTAYRQLTSHAPTEPQFEILEQLLNEQLDWFANHPEDAKQLLEVGDAQQTEGLAAGQHAAVTVLVNSIMNLDETVRNQ